MKEAFVGVDRMKSEAASPTKRIEPNLIFELELLSDDKRASSIFYCNYIRMEEIIKTRKYKDIILSSLAFLVKNNEEQ